MTVEVPRFHSKQNVSRQPDQQRETNISLKTAPGLRFEVQVVAGIEVALAIEEQKAAV